MSRVLNLRNIPARTRFASSCAWMALLLTELHRRLLNGISPSFMKLALEAIVSPSLTISSSRAQRYVKSSHIPQIWRFFTQGDLVQCANKCFQSGPRFNASTIPRHRTTKHCGAVSSTEDKTKSRRGIGGQGRCLRRLVAMGRPCATVGKRCGLSQRHLQCAFGRFKRGNEEVLRSIFTSTLRAKTLRSFRETVPCNVF